MSKIIIFDKYTPLVDVIKNNRNVDLIIIPNLIKGKKNIEYTMLPNNKFIYLIKIQNGYLGTGFQKKSKEEMMQIYECFKYGMQRIIYKDKIVIEFGIFDIRNNLLVHLIDCTEYLLDENYEIIETFKLKYSV
jgi:hypothetical protein